jgi:hypothetical protein
VVVGGVAVVSTIDTIGDQDFYKVELVAGRSYEFGMFGETAGPGGVPLVDSLVEIRRADGSLITSADGGASSQLNVANSGFDAILSYTPSTSGTYFINARAFDNATEDGPTSPIGRATRPSTMSRRARCIRSTGAAKSTAPCAIRTDARAATLPAILRARRMPRAPT